MYVENEYPECIELCEGAQVCLRSILIAHTRGPGRIVIGKNAFLGASCVVTASAGRTLTIGEGAVVTTCAVITSNVSPFTMVGNERAKQLAIVTVPLAMDTPYETFIAGLRPVKPR